MGKRLGDLLGKLIALLNEVIRSKSVREKHGQLAPAGLHRLADAQDQWDRFRLSCGDLVEHLAAPPAWGDRCAVALVDRTRHRDCNQSPAPPFTHGLRNRNCLGAERQRP